VGRTTRILAAGVLVAEALVVLFAVLVAKDLSDLSTATVVTVGSAISVACLLLCAMLKHAWSVGAGWLLQLIILLTGFVLPAMFFMGAVFAVLWFVALRLGGRAERIQADRLQAEPPVEPTASNG
jgi:hypothetical protein